MSQAQKKEILAQSPQAPLPAALPTASVMTPMEMVERAIASGSGVDVIEKLMGLQERWEKSQAKKAYDEAMAQAKAELPVIVKDKRVSYSGNTGFMHETLPGIAKLIDPVLTKYGLSYRFRTASDDKSVTVTCVVSHRLGHSEENSLTGPHDKSGGKNSIQAVGSSVTYLQRYTLKGALGLAAADDDDAVAASQSPRLSIEQADTLRDLLESKGKSREKFLKWAKVESIEDIAADLYDSCVTAINKPVQ